MKKIAYALIFVPFALSACGGSGSGNGGVTPQEPIGSAQLDAARVLQGAYGTADATALASMPGTGTASYAGTAVFGGDLTMDALLAAPEMTADVSLTADFANGSLTGGMDNFHSATDKEVAGDLVLSGGVIAGNGLSADLDGTVGTRIIDAQMGGQFLNDGAQAVSGTIAGSDSTGASFGGAFIADR